MEDEKYLKSSGLWSFSTLFLVIVSMLSFIPVVVIVSDAEGISQKLFQYSVVIGICASVVMSFVELYMEGKYRKNGKSSEVRLWRNIALFHWLIFATLLYAVFHFGPEISKGYI